MQTEILTTEAEIAADTAIDTVTESEIVSTAVEPTVRLSKRLADLGFCSRREADVWIERGWVQVDGVTVDVLGSKVSLKQAVTVQRAATFAQSQAVTILINKPVGYVSGQAENDYTPASALIHPNTRWEGCTNPMRFEHGHLRGLAPAGRLDIDSVGLLVLTQDGRVARTLIGEDSGVEKEYLVRVRLVDAQSLSDEGLALLNFEIGRASCRERV